MSDVLLQADSIAGQDRSRDYGHPKINHDRIAAMWNAYLSIKGYDPRVTASDVAWMMILLKCARHVNAKKADNLVDAAGYIKCVAMIEDSESCQRNGLNGPYADVPVVTETTYPCGNCGRQCDYKLTQNRHNVPVCNQCYGESIKPAKTE